MRRRGSSQGTTRNALVTGLSGLAVLALAGESAAQVQEVTVTTRKREESLQEVPVAVSAFQAADIERLAITDLRNLTKYTSSVIFDNGFGPQDTRVTIRGIAPIRGRQNVAILQDGIDISSQAISTNGGSLLINPRLFDIERVEIVKGPQNALYGRSAFNGAINYIMRQPTEQLTGRVYTDIGSNGQAELRGGISGGLVGNTLLGELSGAIWNFDGFYDNVTTGGNLGGQDGTAFSGSLVWNATEKLRLRLRGEVIDDEYDTFPYLQILPNRTLPIPAAATAAVTAPNSSTTRVLSPAVTSVGAFVGTFPDGDTLQPGISSNPRDGGDYPGIERDIERLTLTADYDAGPVKLTYLGHIAQAEVSQFYDALAGGDTGTAFVGAESVFDDETDLQSHEIRVTSNTEGRVNWAAGGLYWRERVDFLDGSYNCINNSNLDPNASPFQPPCGPRMATVSVRGSAGAPLFADDWKRDTDHYSIYGLVDWEFIERFNLILEARYTWEDLDVAGPDRTVSRIIGDEILLFSPFPPPGGFIDIGNPRALAPNNGLIPASQDDDFLSPKATVQWRPTDEAQIYFSWALANKPAGIALLTGGAAGFDPEGQRFEREEMQVWELGAKSEWFDRRLTVNGAVFFQDYKDKQVSVQAVADNGQLVPRTENASSAEVWGLELDAQWVPTDWLSVFGSYTFLDTEYTDFFEETPGAGNIAQAGVKRPDNCEVIFKDGSNRALCRLNLSGNELEYAPRNAFVGGFTLSAPIGQDMRGFFESNLVYQDDRYVDRFNAAKLDSYTVVDFRLGLRSDTWDIVAYVDNAFEDETIKTGVPNVLTRGLQAVAFPSPFTLVFPAGFQGVLPDLRQFGIRASFRFGGQQ